MTSIDEIRAYCNTAVGGVRRPEGEVYHEHVGHLLRSLDAVVVSLAEDCGNQPGYALPTEWVTAHCKHGVSCRQCVEDYANHQGGTHDR